MYVRPSDPLGAMFTTFLGGTNLSCPCFVISSDLSNCRLPHFGNQLLDMFIVAAAPILPLAIATHFEFIEKLACERRQSLLNVRLFHCIQKTIAGGATFERFYCAVQIESRNHLGKLLTWFVAPNAVTMSDDSAFKQRAVTGQEDASFLC